MDNLHQIDPAHSKQLEIRHNLGAQELVVFRTILSITFLTVLFNYNKISAILHTFNANFVGPPL